MSKTFKEIDPDRTLKVFRHGAKEGAWIQMHRAGDWNTHTFTIAPSDAPALCLAILEAAGVKPFNPEDVPYNFQERTGDMGPANMAAFMLAEHVETQAKRAAAEADRVALEAEAFKLRKAYLEGRAGYDSWNELTDAERDQWLAVARAARELNKEAGQ